MDWNPETGGVAFGPSGYAMEVRVVWNDPASTGRGFEFPRAEATIISTADGETGKVDKFYTDPCPNFEALMVEMVSTFLHPGLRHYVSRAVFDQFRKIEASREYQAALGRKQHGLS